MTQQLYLIDGHAIAYRAYFALTAGSGGDRWQTSEGEPTAGTYGFASILMRLLEQDKPEHIAIAFDTGKTFRNELFEGYKATRAKMPEDLRPQIDRMRELTDIFGFPRLEMEGYEADDVLGSAARIAAEHGFLVKIITGDRDLLQLVDDKTTVNLSGSKLSDAKDYDPAAVKALLGIAPDQVVDYKALVGDPSDNYPGVAGIGPKTAVTLLAEYQTLTGIYDHLDDIKDSVRNKLVANRDNAWLSRELAEIKTNLKPDFLLENCSTCKINFQAVEAFFKTLEFKSLIPKLRALAPQFQAADLHQLSLFGVGGQQTENAEANSETKSIIINSEEALQQLAAKLAKSQLISLDTETTGTDPMNCRLVGISFSHEAGSGYYIPVGHVTGEQQLPLELVRSLLNPILERKDILKVGHNIKYDLLVLKNNGIEVGGNLFDTMIAGWVIDPASRNLGLKPMTLDLLGISMQTIDTLIGKGKNQLTMAEVPVASAAPYAAADADMTLRLVSVLQDALENRTPKKSMRHLKFH